MEIANLQNIHLLTLYPNIHLGHHPQTKKLQKGTFAHWFLIREKTHSEVYNEVHNYLILNKNIRTFINGRFGTAQPLKLNTYVMVVNKATQICVSKKLQPQKTGPYKIINTPTLVTYILEDFLGKQITRHRKKYCTILSQRTLRSRINGEIFLGYFPFKTTTYKVVPMSKSLSFCIDIPNIPSTENSPLSYLAARLKYPNTLRETTLQGISVFDDNQSKIIEFFYHSRKFRLYERRINKIVQISLLDYTVQHSSRLK